MSSSLNEQLLPLLDRLRLDNLNGSRARADDQLNPKNYKAADRKEKADAAGAIQANLAA